MKLRVLESQWIPFVRGLCARTDVETAGVILAERTSNGTVLVAREFLALADNAYLVRRSDQLRIAPLALNRLIRPARDRGWSILTVHTHPNTSEPWFSLADDAGDARLMPSFHVQTPGPHGSLVVAGDSGSVAARVWHEGGRPERLDMWLIGRSLRSLAHAEDPSLEGDGMWFARQRLALGEHGQAALRQLHVGIVGLGGTGSATMVQVAHLGVGELTLVDGDVIEASNVSRIPGATSADAWMTSKVSSAARYVQRLGLGTRVNSLVGHMGREVSPDQLADCDVIFCCVDRHTPRALLNRLSYAGLIPIIDMGSAFRVDSAGTVVDSGGRVVVIGPRRPCLACWGHIDARRLRIEALSPKDRQAAEAEGYIEGAEVAQPSVVAFNTVLSGAAVIEFLRLVTEFAGADDPPQRLSFQFASGDVRRNRLAAGGSCEICSQYRDPGAETSEPA